MIEHKTNYKMENQVRNVYLNKSAQIVGLEKMKSYMFFFKKCFYY